MFPVRDVVERRKFPFVNVALITTNIVAFLWSLTDFEHIVLTYGFTPAHWTPLTVLTSMFLHGDAGHIIGNMWYLFIFGDNVEDRFGHLKYLLFYLVSGVVATYINYLTDPASAILVIGASGAISGVMGAYLLVFPRVKVHVIAFFYLTTLPAFVLIGFWFILQLYFGTAGLLGGIGSGIAYWAHIGGFLFGLLGGLGYRVAKIEAPGA